MTPEQLAERIYCILMEDQKWLVPWEDALPEYKFRLVETAKDLLHPKYYFQFYPGLKEVYETDIPWNDLNGDSVVGPGGTD